jgi:tRNA/rRNA methyltransferase
MAGTDRRLQSTSAAAGTKAAAGTEAAAGSENRQPVIVLVEPQLGENIGAAARAMLNFGLTEMRIVNPRDGWPNHTALNTASGAESVLHDARVFDDFDAAIDDLTYLVAATARTRDMVKPVDTPRGTATRLRQACARGERCGVLFGRERSGLDNDQVSRADSLLFVPTNPGYSSINIAQAVLLMGYEWFQSGDAAAADLADLTRKGSRPATKQELRLFQEHLEAELDACGFLRPLEKRPNMVRNIRNIFARGNLTDQEVRTLRGIVVGLTKYKGQG